MSPPPWNRDHCVGKASEWLDKADKSGDVDGAILAVAWLLMAREAEK